MHSPLAGDASVTPDFGDPRDAVFTTHGRFQVRLPLS